MQLFLPSRAQQGFLGLRFVARNVAKVELDSTSATVIMGYVALHMGVIWHVYVIGSLAGELSIELS